MQVLNRVRGLVVGYCLGDALARSPEPGRGRLLAGTPSLLFLAGVEGLVRGLVREEVTGRPGAIPDTSWHGTARWASRTRQGTLPGVRRWSEAAAPQRWPDGWLSDLALFADGRGSAPAVEAALEKAELDPRPGRSGADSAGDLVLSRTLGVALLAVANPGGLDAGRVPDSTGSVLDAAHALRITGVARDVAAYTHGLEAQVIAVALTRALAECLASGRVQGLCALDTLPGLYEDVPTIDDVLAVRSALGTLAEQAIPYPPVTELALQGLPSGPRTALRATAEGLRCALMHPGRDEVAKAVREALDTGQPAAAAVAGALVGAAHGLDAFPVDAVSRLDVGHVADQLATDVYTQLTAPPTARDSATVDAWLHRYPAW